MATVQNDATAAWRERETQVRALLAEIEVHLRSETKKVSERGATWPQVGDLGHVTDQLEEVVGFLRGGA